MPEQIHHYTLNTGDGRLTDRCEVEDEVLDYLAPMVDQGGGRVPLDLRFNLTPGTQGGWMFTIWERDAPLVTCGLAMNEAEADELWPPLLDLAAQCKMPRPKEPPPVPWLCVVLLPSIICASPQVLGALADLERCLAWALIERTSR